MKSSITFTVLVVTFAIVQLSALGQMLSLDLGNVQLLPNQSGQVRDFFIENLGSSPIQNLFGLNLAFEIGDGTSGPRVEAISLYAGNSVFSAYAVNQTDQGSNPWTLFFGIDSGGDPLTLPGSNSTLVARITLDTTGLSAGNGPWTISANHVGPLGTDTEYVLIDGSSQPITTFGSGSLAIVPEPSSYSEIAGALMLVFVIWRKCETSSGRRRP